MFYIKSKGSVAFIKGHISLFAEGGVGVVGEANSDM
jgi:hypothetical protein